jgi:hypothetical protein
LCVPVLKKSLIATKKKMEELKQRLVFLRETKTKNEPTNKNLMAEIKRIEEQIKAIMIEEKKPCIPIGPHYYAVLKTVLKPRKITASEFADLLQAWLANRGMPMLATDDRDNLIQFIEFNKHQFVTPQQVFEVTDKKPLGLYLKPVS